MKQKIDKTLFELHADICKTLANSKRLEIIALLSQGEKNVNDLANEMGLPKANLSQHLAIMRQKGVVSTRRDGTNIYYSLSNPKIIKACNIMREVLMEKLDESKQQVEKLRRYI